MRRWSFVPMVVALSALGCGDESLSALPGQPGAAGASGASGSGGASGVAGASGAGGGVPCNSPLDCNDFVDCTLDTCDGHVCRHTPQAAMCQNGVTCDGDEVCDPVQGCRAGIPPSCDDDDPCTIDLCVEATSTCKHVPRDADQDGDPDGHCDGGTDCDDNDPKVSGLNAEICGNKKDDDCDGEIDEADCSLPAHDGCADPLVLAGPGTYAMSTAGAKLDLGASCGPFGTATNRDVVAAYTIPDGPPMRVDAKVAVPLGTSAVALTLACGVPSAEIACGGSGPSKGSYVARARAWSVPPGTYPIIAFADQDTTAQVTLSLSEAGAPPTNETCGTAATLLPGTPVIVPLVGTKADVAVSCGAPGGDLVYRLDLAAEQDVRVFATSVDGDATPIVSIRKSPCAMEGVEVACNTGAPASAFARALGPGPVYVVVKSAPTADVELLATLEPPTKAPPDEICATSPPIAPNVDTAVSLEDHTDDVKTCSPGKVDAAYALTLAEPSDVLAVLRSSLSDLGSVSLHTGACATKAELVACVAQSTPMRLFQQGLPPGAYRLVVESNDGSPVLVTPLVRKAATPVLVPFSDDCADAFEIPAAGGTFVGNTSGKNADFSAGCDTSGTGTGAGDQMLKLVLDAPRRVVFDMQGSTYGTLLDVRKGDTCPGTEQPFSCTIGYDAQRSYLDLSLDAGTYWVQIDGYAYASGSWQLAVFVVPP